jgi:uncharacterized protein (TIGR03437 family)
LFVRFLAGGAEITALQFDISCDPPLVEISVMNIPPATANAETKQVFSAKISPTVTRLIIAGLNQYRINDDIVAGLLLSAPEDLEEAACTLRLGNTIAADRDGQPLLLSARDSTIIVSRSAPVRIDGVRHSATLLPTDLAPGLLVSIFGQGFSPGAAVEVDGTPAELLFADDRQINVALGSAIRPGSTARLQVRNRHGAEAAVQVPVAAAVPGLFTQDHSGTGQAAVLNHDMSTNAPENPAERGSIVAVYMTGGGLTDPPTGDGQTIDTPGRLLLPVSAVIDGQAAEVTYAGPAHGLRAEICQINVRIPPAALPGNAVPIYIVVGAATTQDGVTVAIR